MACLAACLGAIGSSASSGSLFAYDRAAPLDLALGKASTSRQVVRQSLVFTGAGSDRLAAYFVHPVSGGPWPLVIWSPGHGGNRNEDLPAASVLARGGVASLLVDPPAGANASTGCDAQKDLDIYVRYVVSRRRAVDLAETLPNVDKKRIAAAGFSQGAAITATLSGVEHRIVAFALKSGRAHFTGYGSAFCTSLSKPELDAWTAKVGVVDPVRWLPLARHAAVLIQNGTKDALSPHADVLALYAAARNPKELHWYKTDHPLNAAADTYRTQWLLQALLHP